MKVCSRCKKEKSFSEFWKNRTRKDGYCNECKICHRRFGKTPKQILHRRKYNKQYRSRPVVKKRLHELSKSPKYRETVKRGQLKRAYNITLEQHKRMYINQNGCCAICSESVPYDKIDLDHNHTTGKIRGLLCRKCNWCVGMVEKNPITKILKYLKKYK